MTNAQEAGPSSKRRRFASSCDICKRKRVRCDSATMPDNICSNCITFGEACTHVAASLTKAKRSYRPLSSMLRDRIPIKLNTGDPHVSSLFEGNAPVRSLVASILCPIPTYEPPEERGLVRQIISELAEYISILEKELCGGAVLDVAPVQTKEQSGRQLSWPRPYIIGENDDHNLSHHLESLTLSDSERFFGTSSTAVLVKSAIDVATQESVGTQITSPASVRRPEFWESQPWELLPVDPYPTLDFPDKVLMTHLVDLYFARTNTLFPILHRPTFDRMLAEGLHYRNYYFGATVLAVISLGSRHSNNPEIFLDGSDHAQHTAGWKWFKQIKPVRRGLSFRDPPSVYEMQVYPLSIIYLYGTPTGLGARTLASLGLHVLQDVGAHRKPPPGSAPSAERELWKRAFWALIAIDIFSSASNGRPRATTKQDYDQDYPIDCDDEYWDHPDPQQAFKQPPGKPSVISGWIHMLKLLDIFSFSQEALYSTRRPEKWQSTYDANSDEKAVLSLDSALNSWVDSVPDHLKWDPNGQNQTWLEQSAMLYTQYYYLQILIHRPFIPTPTTGTRISQSLSSLAICANAARSCIHVVEVHSHRFGGINVLPSTLMALFNSAVVLLLILWGGRRAGLSSDSQRELGDIHKTLEILHVYEGRWTVAGRLADILNDLLRAGKLPPPPLEPRGSKRPREPDGDEGCNLPVHTEELGGLPVYGSTFDFEDTDMDGWLSSLVGPAGISGTEPSVNTLSPLPEPLSLNDLLVSTAEVYGDWENWGGYLAGVEELMQVSRTEESHAGPQRLPE